MFSGGIERDQWHKWVNETKGKTATKRAHTHSSQRRIQKPIKHLRWRVLQK